MAKVTIIGATGQVGSYAAHAVSQFPHVQEMCLYGRPGNEQYLDGLAHDMMDSFAARGTNTRVTFGTNPKELRGSDIIVLTAGVPRKPGQTRLDLALENAKIVRHYAEQVGRMAPGSILLVVTNPVDIMTTVALKYSGMMPHRVFGLGTHLDSMRLKACLAEFFNVHVSEVHTRIIGEHGDTMVPMWSATTIGGIQIDNMIGIAKLPREQMIERVKNSGSYIIQAKGATVFGPGDAIATLIRTIVEDENRMLTVSTQIRREIFGHEGVCISVPARITRGGVFPIGVRLSITETALFGESVKLIKEMTERVCAALDAESQPSE
ncbi:MAG TPA: malate dehydrogenase [Methanocorpusculum sp.]|nr:malate dehydrogenase [Methanocorpusculum sp.]HJK15820.1 malate dehydrogenase [Methanocorpusculum sp.]HJK40621.1 malate dehydrogenase [Methanocorpusculum sp.]